MAQSIQRQILERVQSDIRSLGLVAIDDDNVVIVKADKECERVEIGLAGVVILPFGSEGIPLGGGTNLRDDIQYMVSVIFVDCHRQDAVDQEPADAEQGEPDQNYHADITLSWREIVRKHFSRKRLEGINSVYTCNVLPQAVLDPAEFLARNIWKSTLNLQFISREERI